MSLTGNSHARPELIKIHFIDSVIRPRNYNMGSSGLNLYE